MGFFSQDNLSYCFLSPTGSTSALEDALMLPPVAEEKP
jgi:hypothetical protein